jgi:transcriptional regulator with XRE-family HTH domain
MVNSTEFAKRLQKILDFYGVSATAFAEQIDFNRSTISHLLSGRNKPSLEFVMKVLQQFPEVELYWLLNGTGNFPSLPTSEKQKKVSEELLRKSETNAVPENQEVSAKSLQQLPHKVEKTKNASEIEKIIIFYKDGSFKAYQ